MSYFKIFNKKGENKPGFVPETGSNAAIVIGVITLIIIFYILFLPPEAREELLDDTSSNSDSNYAIYNNSILNEQVGRLEYYSAQGERHSLPNVNLFSLRNAVQMANVNPFTIRNGWFDTVKRNFTFTISDFENTDDIILNFNTHKNQGVLRIRLNGRLIYEYDIDTYNINPIKLNKEFLKPINNLAFEVSGVGYKFWTTNEYSLKDIQVIGYVTDITKQQAQNTFTISSGEKNNLERAIFNFYPQCDKTTVEPLQIILNNRVIYEGVPDCNTDNRFELYKDDLNAGKNTVAFKTTGRYMIDSIYVDTDLQEVSSYIQYFQIPQEVFVDVVEGDANIVIEIFFVDDRQKKRGELNINGHLTYLNQESPYYARNINPFIGPGNNYIELVPETTMNINEIRVSIY